MAERVVRRRNGDEVVVVMDDDVADALASTRIYMDRKGYPRFLLPTGESVYLARFVMGATDPSIFVDHISGNHMDNRRENLRLATNSQNRANSKLPSTNTSGRRGITWHRQSGKWQASIGVRGRYIYLGLFADPDDAARAYRTAAETHFGSFAAHLSREAVK